MIIAREDAPIADEINNVNKLILLGENEKIYGFLREATMMHKLLAKRVWQYKLQKESTIRKTYCDSGTNTIKEY